MTKKNSIKSIAILLVFCTVIMGIYPFAVYAEGGKSPLNVEAIGESGEQQEEAVDDGVFSTANTMSTFGAGALPVTITHNESRFSSFTSDKSLVKNLELTINISANIGLAHGEIVVSPQIGEGFLGAAYPYFSYTEAYFDNWGIVDEVTDNGDGTISIILTDVGAQAHGTVTLVFEFDGENYNGKVSPDAVMMEPIAKVFLEHSYSHSIGGEIVVSAARNGFGEEFAMVNVKAGSSGNYIYFGGQKVVFSALIFNEYGGELLLDENHVSNYSIYAPVGTQFADFAGCVVETGQGAGVQLLNDEVLGVPAGNYYVFTYALPNDPMNPSSGWGNPEGGSGYGYYTEIMSSMVFPVVPEGMTQKIYSALNYKLASEPAEKTFTEEYTYILSNNARLNFRTPGEHFTLNGKTAVAGTANNSISNNAIRTGGSYYDRKSTGNYGNVEVANVKFVLRQGTSPFEPSKMNFNEVNLLIGREGENNLWPVFRVEYKIINTVNSSLSRVEGPYDYRIDDNSNLEAVIALNLNSDVTLQSNEYVDQILVMPMGTSGSDQGVMPPQTSFAFEYTFKAWDGQVWPNVNNTAVGSYNPVHMGWWVEYDSGNGVVSRKIGNEMMALYQEMGSFPIVQSTINLQSQPHLISDESQFVIKGYNIASLGAQSKWINPVVVVSAPSGITMFDYGQTPFEDAQGNVIGNLNVEALSQSATRSFYKITFPEGYEVAPSNGGPDFVFYLKARLPAGLSSGEYKLDIALSSSVGTDFLVSNPLYHNNALPFDTTKADFGLMPGQNYTISNIGGYEQEGIVVTNGPNLLLSSQGRHEGESDWQTDKYISVSDDSQVEIKISAANHGDIPVENVGFHIIVPFNGYTNTLGETSVGEVVLNDVQAYGARIYYYIGNESVAAGDFAATIPSWTENLLPTDVVKAVYISFENGNLLPLSQYSAVITYKVPVGSAPDYNVYSQFFAQCNDAANTYVFASNSQVMSKDAYAINYITSPADSDAYNLPLNLSGRFGVNPSVSVRLSTAIPQKPQHQFVGWRDVLSSDIYYPNEIVSLSKTGRREITFQAVFQPVAPSMVTVRFNSNGAQRGAVVPSEIQTTAGQIVQAPNISTLEKDGYRTTGRFYVVSETIEQTEYWDFAQPVPNIGEIELFVEWEEKPIAETFYTISFNVNGGNLHEKPASISVLEGNKAGILPLQLTRDGYTFAGWSYLSGDDNSVDFNSQTIISRNLEVYAVWKKASVTVTVKTLKYNHNENWQQAKEESSRTVVLKHGEKFSVTPEDIENYVFIENFSDPLTTASVTKDMVINLRYQHERYSIKAVSHIDLDVLQKTAGGNKTISVEKLAKLAELKSSSNKDNKWKVVPRNVIMDSNGLDDLDLTVLSNAYDNDVLISCQWPDGQVAEVVVSIRVVDVKAPTITLNSQQRITFKGTEALPKSESELYSSLLSKGMKVEDNHDRKVKVEFGYLEGGFSDIAWEAGEEYIIFVSAKDSSGNILLPKAVVLSCVG